MNKEELKKILKPLIKECIKESLFEEGVLSGIVTEIATGLNRQPVVVTEAVSEPEASPEELEEIEEERQHKLKENRRKMLDAIGKDSYNGIDLFENTTPMSSAGTQSPAQAASSPFSGVDPSDKGVDISSIFGAQTKVWKKLI